MKRFALLMFAGLLSGPALADGTPPHACGLFCKVWRNVSRRVQVPADTSSWDDGSMVPPSPEQEARIPRPADLVAVHGEVLRKTRADRIREQAAVAEEIRHIESLRDDGPKRADGDTQKPRLGQAD